jgi:hypothetical protein
MTLVAIHQPNYLPWLGFFSKMTQADVFIFLDDAQYTKNSYINRTRILCDGVAKWLTIPVRVPLGTSIHSTKPVAADWVDRHLERMSNYYRTAPVRQEALADLATIYAGIETGDSIANINMRLIRALASRLGIATEFRVASQVGISEKRSNERLIALVRSIDSNATYLSGAGASSYQDSKLFEAAGVPIQFTRFSHPVYSQEKQPFVAGLSVMDAVFWHGWQIAAEVLRSSVKPE